MLTGVWPSVGGAACSRAERGEEGAAGGSAERRLSEGTLPPPTTTPPEGIEISAAYAVSLPFRCRFQVEAEMQRKVQEYRKLHVQLKEIKLAVNSFVDQHNGK